MAERDDIKNTAGARKFVQWLMLAPADGRQKYLKLWRLVAEDYEAGGWRRVEQNHPGLGFTEPELREALNYMDAVNKDNQAPIRR